MLPALSDHRVAVHVREQADAHALRVGRVSEPVDGEVGLAGMEQLAHPLVQLVVGHRAPELRLLVAHWHEANCKKSR